MATSAAAPPDASTPAPAPVRSTHFSRGMRETIESIAIALALAFLFKTFEAEAFVIPTGSMAPTLMGRHKDIVCPECGYHYTTSGSEEADENGNDTHNPNTRVVACTCPICRYTMAIEPEDPAVEGSDPNPSYTGDRIWVSKVPYHFVEPRRFDVLVFRWPQGAESYYIKRLVGLPNETLRIFHGDLFVKGAADSAADFGIVRKPPEKLKAMAQVVHDNDYVSQTLIDKNWPTRWTEWGQGEVAQWQISDDTRTYSIGGKQTGDAWIRYEHTVPSEANWFHKQWQQDKARPQLITDFYAFNTGILRQERGADTQSLGMHWVGDLLLECQLDVKSDTGTILLDLVKGGRHFGCQIDVASGKARLSIDGLPTWQPTADTPVRGSGTHEVTFANADRQLVLWVDGKPINFDRETTYDDLNNDQPQSTADDPGDLAPLGIGSRGVALDVNHLRVLRDIYYIADTSLYGREPISDYPQFSPMHGMDRRQLADFWASPDRWSSYKGTNIFDSRKPETFPLGPDQFFVLGDNSPASSDARLWGQHYVDRELLVGKALMIYWPHPLRLQIPGTEAALGVVPNVPKMGLIR